MIEPRALDRHEFSTSVSIGIVIGETNYESPEHILRDADSAMYKAKGAGKGCYFVFNKNLYQLALDHFSLEAELRRALKNNEFILNFQPIVDLKTDQLYGFEALVRWQHPVRGLLYPGTFMPLAEESESVELIDFWVLKKACQTITDWQTRGLIQGPLRVSINFSARHFSKLSFFGRIDELITRYGVAGKYLTFEVTEHGLMKGAESVTQTLEQIRDRDIHISIDDFGTGYSSLSYLHRYPINILKIDRCFVRDLHQQPQNAAIVRAIIALANSLKVNTMAEGVETATERDHLAALGSHFAQGHLFASPMQEEAATNLLSRAKIVDL
ncbi:bifunctional diguanylate cyclase/phosphodiesterase [Halomicronema sp. CCY15110]|uniref:putative bifunctional diguanylate cyclase/phosphodiesterase n=1 Tax=Halomicronema sp. CCY15110 TaxID=2767773 RepID=UPI001950406A|nr:GGDEF domain-containing phosphodiesterase [Halomicronema sp. CCY15110]